MSVVFVVGSDEQLSSGVAWCKAIAQSSGASITALVIGVDRAALQKRTQRVLAEQLEVAPEETKVQSVVADVPAVLACLNAARCTALVMVHGTDLEELQQSLFERCRAPAFWLRASGPPPAARARLFAALGETVMVTTVASEKLFGFSPAAVLADPEREDEETSSQTADKVIAEIEAHAPRKDDLVLVGIGEPTRDDSTYAIGLKLLDKPCTASLALIHDGESLRESLGWRVQSWFSSVAPPMDRDERIELANDLEAGSQPNLEYFGLISAAAMLAAFGLLQNSAAVIIGAMLIAPLMTPILGAGLALTYGNRPLFRSALTTIVLGFFCALLASLMFGLLVRFSESYLHVDLIEDVDKLSEMRARCRPSPIDLCVGLVGGIAASYARTRRHLSAALSGAAIAAALVPPIATAGLHIAFGVWELPGNAWPISGPLLLVSVNVLTIMIGSSFVLWARGMRADRKLSAKDRWAPRMLALLMLLTSLALVSILPVT